MPLPTGRVIVGTLVAAVGIVAGALLGRYAEADDAPGGVVIAMILILGSVGLGLRIAMRQPRKSL